MKILSFSSNLFICIFKKFIFIFRFSIEMAGEFTAVFVKEEDGSVDIKEECVEEVDPLSTSPSSIEGTEKPRAGELANFFRLRLLVFFFSRLRLLIFFSTGSGSSSFFRRLLLQGAKNTRL